VKTTSELFSPLVSVFTVCVAGERRFDNAAMCGAV
jgi:hypothetical protein